MTGGLVGVCLVAPLPPPYGGIQNWTVLVRRHAQSRTDLNLQIIDIAPRWRAVDDLVIWKRILGGGLQLLRDFAVFLRALVKRPDVVHITTSGRLASIRDLVFLATARCFSIPSIYHIRFGRVPQIAVANNREWLLVSLAIRMARLVIAIDADTAAVIEQRLPCTRVVRIPNGVDLNMLPQGESSTGTPKVVYLGHVLPTKGVAELIQAWNDLAITGWRCLVIGAGSSRYRTKLMDTFRPEAFEFLPEMPHADAMQLLAAADVFVLPSHTEGFPNVIVEAMALGKAIIATSVGAIPEMLAGGCGIVVPPQDKDALCAALRQVMSDPELRAAMGARARRKACKEYAMDKVFEQCVAVWHETKATG